MKYTRNIVAGYELLNELKKVERNASDDISIKDINTISVAIGHLEDSLSYIESMADTQYTLEEYSKIYERYMQELKEIEKHCTTPIEKNHIQNAIAEAEESSYYVKCVQESFVKKLNNN